MQILAPIVRHFHTNFRASLVPVSGKLPARGFAWKQFQQQTSRLPLPRLLDALGKPHVTGAAVLLGAASASGTGQMLFCADFDTARGYDAWRKAHPEIARLLPAVRTRRGTHVYGRAAVEAYERREGYEYRGSRTVYVVLPGSLLADPGNERRGDPCGRRYEWLYLPDDELPDELPCIDPVACGLLSVRPTSARRRSSPIRATNSILCSGSVGSRVGTGSSSSQADGVTGGAVLDGSPPAGIRDVADSDTSDAAFWSSVKVDFADCRPLWLTPDVEALALRCVPRRPGQRNTRILDLVRTLQGQNLRWTRAALTRLFDLWWCQARQVVRTQARCVSWRDFMCAWQTRKHQAKVSLDVATLLADAREVTLPPEALSLRPREQSLLSCCVVLGRKTGGRFYLSREDMERLTGQSGFSIERTRRTLLRGGWIREVRKADHRRALATQYQLGDWSWQQ